MYSILIVEDDPMVAMINEQYVRRNGMFTVAGKCRDGAAAVAWLEKHPVDLVLMDVFMPVMSGIEALRLIREKHIPVTVIMVTAANDQETVGELLQLGVIDYLVKPFSFDRFRLALEKFTMRREALQGGSVFNQSSIDQIFGSVGDSREAELPKGIQASTLATITECLAFSGSTPQTGEEIAAHTGVSVVTARRYLTYLVESGRAVSEMNYQTGGRPSVLYRIGRNR